MFMREKRRARFVYLDDTWRQAGCSAYGTARMRPDPEGELALDELKQLLRSEIRRVPPLLRNVMVLRDIQGLTIKDVAEDCRSVYQGEITAFARSCGVAFCG